MIPLWGWVRRAYHGKPDLNRRDQGVTPLDVGLEDHGDEPLRVGARFDVDIRELLQVVLVHLWRLPGLRGDPLLREGNRVFDSPAPPSGHTRSLARQRKVGRGEGG